MLPKGTESLGGFPRVVSESAGERKQRQARERELKSGPASVVDDLRFGNTEVHPAACQASSVSLSDIQRWLGKDQSPHYLQLSV